LRREVKQINVLFYPACSRRRVRIDYKKRELAAVLIYSLASRRTREDEESVLSVEAMAVCSEPA